MQIFQSDITIIVGEAVILLGLIVVLVLLLKKQKSQKELQGRVWRKAREQTLTGLLENDYASEELKKQANVNLPYEVKYKEALERNTDAVSIQVVVHSGVSIQKYVFNVIDVFHIGSDEKSELVLQEEQVLGSEAELLRKKDKLYLKKTKRTGSVQIKRGKKSYEIDDKPMEICNNDIIALGNADLEITYVG